jgi:hypothetical protein
MLKQKHVGAIALVLAWAFLFTSTATWAQSSVGVTVDQSGPGQTVSSDFEGFSVEMLLAFPDPSGNYLFNGNNAALIGMFKSLGIKSLRMGGNSADNINDNNGQLPIDATCAAADKCPNADSLYAFAQAAGVNVLFTLRLKVNDPNAAATEAAYIMKHYAASTKCFQVGNEPNVYISSYGTYDTDFKAYRTAVLNVAPAAKFCAPAVTNGGGQPWAEQFATEYKGDPTIELVCGHYYPGARTGTISGDINYILDPSRLVGGANNYTQYLNNFPSSAIAAGETWRIEETNSLVNQGEAGVSDVYTAALWSLDYMHWWAQHNAGGLNFHEGASSVYNAFTPTTQSTSYTARPVAYGIKAFSLGGAGQNLTTTVSSNPDSVNITAYGLLDPTTGNLFVTLINKEHFTGAKNATVTLTPGATYTGGQVWTLNQTNGDVTVATGITLGGATIGGDGTWNGTASAISPGTSGQFTISVPAASAAVVELTGRGTLPPPPQPPSGLTASAVSSSAVNLTWTASPTSGVTYDVFRSTTSGFTPSSSNQIASGVATTSFADSGLACNTTNFYLVEAANSGGTSSSSNQASTTTQACPVGPTIQINAGGPAVAPFVADEDFSGGSAINHANTIDLSGVTNPAPMAVYQTARTGNFTYTIPGFGPGTSQTVRLHFAETFFSTAGSRTFNVSINGTQVLANFDIFATAGAKNKAIVEQFTENANANGQYVIQFTSVVNNSLVSGIEIVTSASCNLPTAPSGLSATAASASQINLSWTASTSNCTPTYNVFRSTTSGFTPSSSNQIASGVGGTTFSDTGLTCNTTYFYLVEATDSAGSSAPSNQASASTHVCPTTSVEINSGGPGVSPFMADVDFTGGGTINHANTIDLSGVTNPAPMAVYQTARVGNFTYTVPGFAAGSSHTVRLHFAETFFSSAGSRTFNTSINGTQVLTNFDIFATAGAKNKAVIEQFTENANASGQYVIQFTSVANQSLVSGIEIQ